MSATLTPLLERAQEGDPAAFQDLVAATINDVRLFIASYVPTSALGEALLREVFAAIRRELARCPVDDVSGWMCRTAGTLMGVRLAEATRSEVAAKDPLTHLVAQAGAEALALNHSGVNPAAAELPRRLPMQPPSLRQLLQRHYQEGLTVATIAEKQGLVESEVAQALLAARARMDWSGVAEVGDTADRTFPSVLEDFLTGTLVPDTRALLVAGVMYDQARAVQFERQVRLHLLIQALLTPFDAGQVKELIAALPSIRNESSRLIVPPRGNKGTGRITARTTAKSSKPGSGPRPGAETTRNRRQITETGGAPRGVVPVRPAGSRVAAVVDPDELAEGAPRPPNRMPLYIGGGITVLGLLVLVIMSLGPSTAVQVGGPTVAAPVKQEVLGDPSFALIHQAEGQGLIRHSGQTRPVVVGESFSPGDGLELGSTGAVGALIADQVRLTLRPDTRVSDITLQGQVLALQIAQGRVQVDHRRGAKVTAVAIRTPQGLVTLPDASALVEVVDGVTQVQVGRGKPQIARVDGKAMIEGTAGGVVLVRAGSDPAVDGGGSFVRGIRFGEGVVTIGRNQWLSYVEALGAGLSVGAGARLGQPVQISGAGMDFDTKRMLDMGLVSDDGRLALRQVLPNGDYDLLLWVAGPVDVRLDQITLAVAGAPVPLGPASTQNDRWRRIGPCRIQVRGHLLDLALGGLGNAHLAGLALAAAGPLDGSMPPMIILVDPAPGATIPPFAVALRTRVDAAGGVAKVTFFNGDQQIGEATTPPYSFVWRTPPVGPYSISAVVTDSAGVTSRSAVVGGTVQELSQARGLIRETWRGIGGGNISDLRGHLASPAQDIDLVPRTDIRLNGHDFGARFRAALLPPTDGEYIIEVLSDDSSEVWLSTDEDPANRRLVCSLAGYADVGQWSKMPSQRSAPIALKGGQRYFLEVLYKQGAGGLNLQLGWIRPDGATDHPIPGDRFVPLLMTGVVPPPRDVTPVAPSPTATVAAAPTGSVPPVLAREVPSAPAGPAVSGAVAPSAQVANLSDLGITDWIHYGLVDATSVTRRRGGPEQLSVARTADAAGINRYDNNFTRFAWNDGASVPVVAATTTGWFTGNRGKGFTFTAPADPGLRRLMVWVGGHDTHGIFSATLSDGSAPAYRDESINIGNTDGWFCYTLYYRAKTSGAKLTITYASDKVNDGNLTLQAAALSEYSDGKARFVKGINLGGENASIDGNAWISQKDAEIAGLVIYNSRRVSGTGDPLPAADAAMKPMLRTGVAAKGGELELHDRGLPNGRYDVTLYMTETNVANSHLFDVTVNDASLTDLGQLPKNGWAAYGPLTATVTKGVLSIIAKGKKGSPQLMGIAVHTAADAPGSWTNAFPGGRAHAIPGTILFADFDRGANGVAFQEREDKQRNPCYRPEPVGINQYHGSPVVAHVPDGEWLRYTVNAKDPGTYTVTVKYGKANGADAKNARVQFEVDGRAVGGELRLEDTQRWDNAKTVTSTAFPLTPGIHDLRALFRGEQDEIADFWSMEFKRIP